MRLHLCGVRGSTPAPGPSFIASEGTRRVSPSPTTKRRRPSCCSTAGPGCGGSVRCSMALRFEGRCCSGTCTGITLRASRSSLPVTSRGRGSTFTSPWPAVRRSDALDGLHEPAVLSDRRRQPRRPVVVSCPRGGIVGQSRALPCWCARSPTPGGARSASESAMVTPRLPTCPTTVQSLSDRAPMGGARTTRRCATLLPVSTCCSTMLSSPLPSWRPVRTSGTRRSTMPSPSPSAARSAACSSTTTTLSAPTTKSRPSSERFQTSSVSVAAAIEGDVIDV